MADFSLVKSETVPLTHELALKHREMKASPTERVLEPSRVKFLRSKVQDGLFVCPTWAIATYDGNEVRMNGNHSATALCETNGEFPVGLSVHIDKFDVTSEIGLASLFRQFDSRQSGRSTLDVSGAYQGLYEGLAGVDRRYALIACKGISWYLRTVEGVEAPTGDNVGQLMMKMAHHGFILWLGTILTPKTPELKRDQIISAMYGTFLVNEGSAREFWLEVAKDSSNDEGAVTHILSRVLLKAHEEKNPTRKLKAGQFYGICVKGWNAWREAKAITGLSHPVKKDAPDLIA